MSGNNKKYGSGPAGKPTDTPADGNQPPASHPGGMSPQSSADRELPPLTDDPSSIMSGDGFDFPLPSSVGWMQDIVHDPAAKLATSDTQNQGSHQRNRASTAEPPHRSIAGLEVGGYRLVDVLGRGGMGVVFRAVQLGTLREVALKVTRVESRIPGRPQRFIQEARIAAKLDHPHIAHIYDAKMVDQYYCCAMELVEGQTLDVYVQEHAPSLSDKVRLMVKICRAVHDAHGLGVVHRDLKPSNVLVTPDGEPKIVDFGLAKMVGDQRDNHLSETSSTTGVTREGTYVGTPGYMAPEQALGHVSEVGPHSDIFSLGVLLYVLTTGTHPFRAQGQTPMEILARVVHAEPELPTMFAPVPLELEAIILKAMRKAAAERYETAADLADDLQHYLDDEPVQRAPLPLAHVILGGMRRKRRPLALVGAGLLLVAGALLAARAYLAHEQRMLARQTTAEVADHLARKVKPILGNLRVMQQWGTSGTLDVSNPRRTAELVVPLLATSTNAVYFTLADTAGNSVAVMRLDQGYLLREAHADDRIWQHRTHWTRYGVPGEPDEHWDQFETLDARTQPWYEAAHAIGPKKRSSGVAWTDLYTLRVGRQRGISVSTVAQHGDDELTIAIHLPVSHLSDWISALRLGGGRAAVLATTEGEILGTTAPNTAPNIAPTPMRGGQTDRVAHTMASTLAAPTTSEAMLPELFRQIASRLHTHDHERPHGADPMRIGDQHWWFSSKDAGFGPHLHIGIAVPRTGLVSRLAAIFPSDDGSLGSTSRRISIHTGPN